MAKPYTDKQLYGLLLKCGGCKSINSISKLSGRNKDDIMRIYDMIIEDRKQGVHKNDDKD